MVCPKFIFHAAKRYLTYFVVCIQKFRTQDLTTYEGLTLYMDKPIDTIVLIHMNYIHISNNLDSSLIKLMQRNGHEVFTKLQG